MSLLRSTILAAALITSGVASASNYFVVVPITRAESAQPTEVSLTLHPGTLPAAVRAQDYSFDFNSLLNVTGDKDYNPSGVNWEVSGGTLPSGLTLTRGMLTGRAEHSTKGDDFTLTAAYKEKDGRQSYRIVVNGAPLDVVMIAASNGATNGGAHTCAVTAAGAAQCWGDNSRGQLGTADGTTSSAIPVTPAGLGAGVARIATGPSQTCALLTDTSVRCWGANGMGNLGTGDTDDRSTPTTVIASGAVSIAAGSTHSCAAMNDGNVLCWGSNLNGQLGTGDYADYLLPQRVSFTGAPSIVSVSTSLSHTCALSSGGGVWCWGDNIVGALGNDSTESSVLPVQPVGLGYGVVEVAAGGGFSCAVLSNGSARCWGQGTAGRLGHGAATHSYVPVTPVGLNAGVQSISTGNGHACAVMNTGDAMCWGQGLFGKLGSTSLNSLVPRAVAQAEMGYGVTKSISAGTSHTCAVTSKGGAWCWGQGTSGQLGNNAKSNMPYPVNVIR